MITFKQPYFITPHAIDRFQQRIEELPAKAIILIIQLLLQKRTNLLEFDVKDGKIRELYRKEYENKPLYIPVIHDKNRKWPVVPTVMGKHSVVHGRYIRGEYDEAI